MWRPISKIYRYIFKDKHCGFIMFYRARIRRVIKANLCVKYVCIFLSWWLSVCDFIWVFNYHQIIFEGQLVCNILLVLIILHAMNNRSYCLCISFSFIIENIDVFLVGHCTVHRYLQKKYIKSDHAYNACGEDSKLWWFAPTLTGLTPPHAMHMTRKLSNSSVVRSCLLSFEYLCISEQ